MITEIDGLEFLSVLALSELSENNNSLKWEYSDLCKKAYEIEQRHPSIQVNLDAYFIESFRLKSAEHVIVGLHEIEIINMPFDEVQSIFRPCLPSTREYETIINVLGL